MRFLTLNNYINKLLSNHNQGAMSFQQNLFSKIEFYELLKPVITLLANNSDLTVDEYRNILFEKSGIKETLKKYILEEKSVPGLSLSYGTNLYNESLTIGLREEVRADNKGNIVYDSKKVEKDTIYDLASTSKTFTMLAILKLAEDGLISLDDKIVYYAPQFRNLKAVTIYDLLAFQTPLKTSKRIEECDTIDEALEVLFNIKVGEKTNRSYTDMGAMVLKYVVEGVTKKTLLNYLKDEIFDKMNMNNTTSLIGAQKQEKTAPTNFDVKILSNGKLILNKEPEKGVPYDPKARKLYFSGNSFVGHAGMFSTSEDMAKLGHSLITGKLIKRKLLDEASIVRTPFEKQYHGYLNFVKNENKIESEVHPALSAKTIASPGWCGTYFMYDPVNKLYMFTGTNRSHNRITYVGDGMHSLMAKDENNKEYIILPDGRKILNTSNFAYERDEIIREQIIRILFQYKMLEDVLELDKEKDYTKSMHRNVN